MLERPLSHALHPILSKDSEKEGLEILAEARQITGLPVVTE